MKKKINVGIIGLGTVGYGVYKQIKNKASLISKRSGILLNVKSVCDTNKKLLKSAGVPKSEQVFSYKEILEDPEIDCVVELIGGVTIAKKIVLEALRAGKDVVSANKALLSEEGEIIFATAQKCNQRIMFEASVGGGIPIIKAVRESLVANNINTILSIINGTCNYILTKMAKDNISFKEALSIAQKKGYAEADPALDIEGIDAAHKITLLAELAYGRKINFSDVSGEGITNIEQWDIDFAQQLGYVIKLIALAKKTAKGLEVRVQPTLLSNEHILANVNDSYNAVYLMCDDVENLLFYGRGAGRMPTASAVVSDILDLARESEQKIPFSIAGKSMKIINISSILSRYYVRFIAIDKPGVLAKIADILGKSSVSISDVIQKERQLGKSVPLVLITHATSEKNIKESVARIEKLAIVTGKTQVLRIEE